MWNEDYARKLNTRVVLAVLETLLQSQTGWLNCSDKPILVVEFPVCVFLENAVEVFFEEFSQSAKAVCEQNGRTSGNWLDVKFALEKLFGKQLDVSHLLHVTRHVVTERQRSHKKERIPSNPLASEQRDVDSELIHRERWMPPLPPPYTYRVSHVYHPTRIRKLEDERQVFLVQKLQVEEMLLSEEEWTRGHSTFVCDTDMLPRLKEPSKDDNSIEEEKELLEFLFEEKGKDQSAKTADNIKVDRQMLVQRFERIMNDVDSSIE